MMQARMTMMLAGLAGAALTVAVSTTQSLAQPSTPIEGKVLNQRFWPEEATRFVRTGGPARSCIVTADTVFVVNNENSLVFMNDGEFYYNELQSSCDGVQINGMTMSAGNSRRQLCSGISLTLPDRAGGNPNALCHLGKFEPVRLVGAGDDDATILNQGQTIRRPPQ